jgi:hypothetical protein
MDVWVFWNFEILTEQLLVEVIIYKDINILLVMPLQKLAKS